jgi:hypothetical protein
MTDQPAFTVSVSSAFADAAKVAADVAGRVNQPTITNAAVDAYQRAWATTPFDPSDALNNVRAGLAAAYEFLPIRGCNGYDGCTCYQKGVRDGLEAAGTTC